MSHHSGRPTKTSSATRGALESYREGSPVLNPLLSATQLVTVGKPKEVPILQQHFSGVKPPLGAPQRSIPLFDSTSATEANQKMTKVRINPFLTPEDSKIEQENRVFIRPWKRLIMAVAPALSLSTVFTAGIFSGNVELATIGFAAMTFIGGLGLCLAITPAEYMEEIPMLRKLTQSRKNSL